MRYRSPRSHPANCRLPRRSLTVRLGLHHWRIALVAGLLLLSALAGGTWKLAGQDLDKLARDDAGAISPAYQQMLVLRIATLAEALHFGGQEAETPLRTNIAALDRAHTALQRRITDNNRPSPEAVALYHGGPQSLDRAMQGFLNAGRRFLAARETEAGELAYHRLLALSETTLPLRLNQLTDLIDARLAKQQLKLQRLRTGAAAIGLAALLLAALFGFQVRRRSPLASAQAAPQSLPTLLTIDGVRHEVGRALPSRAGGRAGLRAVARS